ncbi:hypothetical protein [Planctomycetes bacterium CA13]
MTASPYQTPTATDTPTKKRPKLAFVSNIAGAICLTVAIAVLAIPVTVIAYTWSRTPPMTVNMVDEYTVVVVSCLLILMISGSLAYLGVALIRRRKRGAIVSGSMLLVALGIYFVAVAVVRSQ